MIYLVLYLYLVGVYMAGMIAITIHKDALKPTLNVLTVLLWFVSIPVIIVRALVKDCKNV